MPAPGNLSLGPGRLYVANAPAVEPATLATAIDLTVWSEIGYTNEGSTFSYELTSDPIEVAEEFEALSNKTTGRNGSVAFAMAENTVRNLTLAFNGGKVTRETDGSFGYEPPEPGEELRRALLFVAEDKTERWIFRQVFQTGSVSMDRRKGSDKTLIAVTFSLEKPSTGKRPFRAIYAGSRSGGATGVTPASPSALVISAAAGPGNVTVSRVSGGEAAEAPTYTVHKSADGSGAAVATGLPAVVTSANGTPVTVSVMATNSFGATVSNAVTVTPFQDITAVTLQAVGGDGVVNITSTATGASTMVLSEGPTANGPWTAVNTVSAASMTYQRTGRANTVQYFYKVDASNVGASRTSAIASATPIGTVVPITTLSSRNTLRAFSSPYPIARYREPGRTKVVIRNLAIAYNAAVPDSGKAIQVLYSTVPNTSGNQPADTGWTTVPVGSEFVDTSGNINKLFVRVDPANTNAGSQLVEVYSEVTVQ